MNPILKKLSVFCLVAATVCGAFLLPQKAEAAETLYDDAFDTVAKVGEANSCYSAQGMAVGDEYLYFVQIGDNDARAIVHRIEIESGDRELMYNSETGNSYFTNFSHANDLDWVVVDGVEYLCVLASPKLLLFQIDDTDLIPYAEYDLKYNGGSFGPGGMAVEGVSGNRVSYLFKWDKTISHAKMPITKTEGSINVVIKCTLDVSKVEVDGKAQNFSHFVNQGMGYSDGYLFVPITGNESDDTINHSLILAYDISNVKTNARVYPDEEKTFYVISEEYPALFEIEDCGVSDDGKLYFNTNSRRTNRDTKHDGAFVLNDFVHKAKPTYTVQYNAGGGTGSMKSATVETGTPLTPAQNTFKRTGYTFAGWQAYSELKKQNVKIGDTVAEGDTITLTAQWTANPYTVQYNANGGNGSMSSVTVAGGTPLADVENAFTREGYTFTGWAPYSDTQKKNLKIGDVPANGDTVIMYAQWVKNSPTNYTVKYNAGGGTGSMPAVSVSVKEALKPAENAFTREGYTFTGWVVTSALSGAEVKIGATVSGGDVITFTAQWEKVTPTTYTVIYDGNGAEGTMESATAGADTPLTPAENAFIREGYTFTGWVATSTLTGTEVKLGDGITAGDTITLTAQWSQDTYTVVYNGNGGTGSMKEQSVPATTAFSPAKNRFKRDGYAFLGWKAVSTLTGGEIAEGAAVAAGDTVTLTAQWGMYGDANGDGKVNIADAFVIRLYDWGYYRIPADRLSLLDMNRDGVVNTADAHILFACLAGAIEMPIYE